MISLRQFGKRLGSGIKIVAVPLFAAFLLITSVEDSGPAWSAKTGHGTPGTFTIDRCDRGKQGCSWTGTFVSDDGWTVLTDVGLADGHRETHVGQRIRAVDTGGDTVVYPAGGGSDWLDDTVAIAASICTLVVWTVVMLTRILRRRRKTPAADWRSGSFPG
jgi:hypothetical protein